MGHFACFSTHLTPFPSVRSSGIGRAAAIMFAKEGADVAIVYLPQEEKDAQEAKKKIEAEKRTC